MLSIDIKEMLRKKQTKEAILKLAEEIEEIQEQLKNIDLDNE